MNQNGLDKVSFQNKSAGRIIGSKIIYYDKVDSTMTEAKEYAKSGCEEGLLIVAGEQVGGRGRLGRSWASPPGGLWMSFVLSPQLPFDEIPLITLLSGVAICRSIKKLYGIVPGLKWPNDIVINGRKVCGILTEGVINEETLSFAVVGIGLNINFQVDDLPEDIRGNTATLLAETGKHLETEVVLKEVLSEINELYSILQKDKKEIIELWKQYSITLGEEITAISEKHTVSGRALDITEKGHLVIIESVSGKEIKLNSGEISIRKKNSYA